MTDCAVMFCANNLVDKCRSIQTNYLVPGFGPDRWKEREMYTFGRMTPPIGSPGTIMTYLNEVESIRVVGLVKHNLSSLATWRIRVWYQWSNTSDPPVYDSGWTRVHKGLNQFGALPWGSFNWGELSYEVFLGAYNRVSMHVLPELAIGSRIQIDIRDDETISTDGFQESARVWISDAWQPEFSASYGSSVSFTDGTDRKVMESGVEHISARLIKRRGMNVILDNIDKKSLMFNFLGPYIAVNGASVEGVVILEPLDDETMPFQTIYGSIQDKTVTATHSVFNRMSTVVSVQEKI